MQVSLTYSLAVGTVYRNLESLSDEMGTDGYDLCCCCSLCRLVVRWPSYCEDHQRLAGWPSHLFPTLSARRAR